MRNPVRHRRAVPLLAKVISVAAGIVALAAGLVPGILAGATAVARPATATATVHLSVPVLPAAVPASRSPVGTRSYTVRPGDTLSGVAARLCGHAADWTGIYAASRAAHLAGPDANAINPGQELAVSCRYLAAMLKYAPPPAPPAVITAAAAYQSAPASYEAPQYQTAAYQAPAATYHGSGSMQQCIIARESGGNAQVMNSSGHYGLYQFSASTWAAHGGNPSDFGRASVAEQNQVYDATVAADGYSDWSPYDGCGA